jgi:hypothetical protein
MTAETSRQRRLASTLGVDVGAGVCGYTVWPRPTTRTFRSSSFGGSLAVSTSSYCHGCEAPFRSSVEPDGVAGSMRDPLPRERPAPI